MWRQKTIRFIQRRLRRTLSSILRYRRLFFRYFSPGTFGERCACNLYCKLNGLVLERNWRDRWGEIDLVVQRGRTLVIVEVKTRHESLKGDFAGEASYDERKQDRIERAGRRLIKQYRKILSLHRINSIAFDLIVVQYRRWRFFKIPRIVATKKYEGPTIKLTIFRNR